MPDHDLPPDLATIEQALAGRDPTRPDPQLRQRVLKAVRRELRPRRRPVGALVGVAAAAGLLLANLSMSAANSMTWPLQADPDRAQVEATADRIRGLTPELSEAEVRRQALVMRGAAAAMPAFSCSPSSLPRLKEHGLWVTP